MIVTFAFGEGTVVSMTWPGTLASTSLQLPIDANSPAIAGTPLRLWAALGGVTSVGVQLLYSSDGQAWTAYPAAIDSGSTKRSAVVVYADSRKQWHLHAFTSSATSSTATSLTHRAVHALVDQGAISTSALTANLTIDAGGPNVGTAQACAFVTNTELKPRLWVLYRKATSASSYQINLAYGPTGTAADSYNWASSVISNVGSLAGAQTTKFAAGTWWRKGGVDQATLLLTDSTTAPNRLLSITFDPTVDTPSLPAANTVGALASGSFDDMAAKGQLFAVAAINDLIMVAMRDPSLTNQWKFYTSTDGSSWSPFQTLSNIGRAALSSDGASFWLVSTNSYVDIASEGDFMSVRRFTPSLDAAWPTTGVPAFSTMKANALSLVPHLARAIALMRTGTAAPYVVKADTTSEAVVSLGAFR